MSDDMGKYGIKDNTGLGVGGMFHVSAPYDSNGQVFVRVNDPEWGEVWERVDADKADPQRMIRCVMCDKPAVSLDHLWPYYEEMTRCAEHYGADYDPENAEASAWKGDDMAREPKVQHCFNCGEEIGVYVRYPGDEPECCGKIECMRELRYQMEAEMAERHRSAEDDGYERYAY